MILACIPTHSLFSTEHEETHFNSFILHIAKLSHRSMTYFLCGCERLAMHKNCLIRFFRFNDSASIGEQSI